MIDVPPLDTIQQMSDAELQSLHAHILMALNMTPTGAEQDYLLHALHQINVILKDRKSRAPRP